MRNNILLFILALFILYSCDDDQVSPTESIQGMKPIYQILDNDAQVKSLDARPFDNLGKIVSQGSYIYINERFKGIHVINNIDPRSPVTSQFWQINGAIDFTIKDNFLYIENSRDLLTIDISDPAQIILMSRIENLSKAEAQFPPNYNGPFECIDTSKGYVVDWEMTTIENPKCRI